MIIWGAALGSALFCLYPKTVFAQNALTQPYTDESSLPANDIFILDTIQTSAAEESTPPAARATFEHKRQIDTSTSTAASALSDLLEGESLLRVQDSGGRLQRQTLSMRGSAAQDILLTYHGITLNSLSWASADLSLIPAKLLSHAVITPSSGSEKNGSGAIGGLIELESAFPTNNIEISTSVGSLKDLALFGRKTFFLPSFAADIALFADTTAGDFEYMDAQNTRHMRTHNGAWRYGTQLHLLFDAQAASIDFLLYTALFSREIAGLAEFPEAYAHASETGALVLASAQADFIPFELGKSETDLSLTVNHRYTQDIYDNPRAFLGQRRFSTHYNENDTSIQLNANFHYATSFLTTIQLAYAYQRVDAQHLVMLSEQTTSHNRHILSLRAEESASFFDDTLSTFLGLRLDILPHDDFAFSPRLSIGYAPTYWFSLKASAAYATRLPAFDERYLRTESIRGNESLSKQTAFLADVILRFDIPNRFFVEISGFYHLHRDLIRFLPITAYMYEAQNLPLSQAHGLDLQTELTLWRHFHLSLGYTWNASFVREGHLPIPGIPTHKLTARARLLLEYSDLWLQATYSAHIAQNLSGQYARHNPFRLDAHAALMLYNHLRLTLDIHNITNDRESEDFRQYPLPGITAMAGLELTWD